LKADRNRISFKEYKEELYREASTIKYFAFLKFDVAKLKDTRRNNKKTGSTTIPAKQL